MENILLSLAVGISSSLLATAFLLAAAEMFRKVLLPWYADKIYRGVRLDGDWELVEMDGEEVDPAVFKMNLNLKQNGDAISGTYSHYDTDRKYTDIYHLSGRIRDRYLMATAVPASNRMADGVTFLFYIHNSKARQVLTGRTLYCAPQGDVKAASKHSFAWREP